jgi:CheY-like chemotaxis protein
MRKILVVEDSASTRAFVRSTLESEAGVPDVEVSEATSGFDALRLLPRGRQRGLRLGASGYLAKPFAGKSLVDEVLRHLASGEGKRLEG